MNVYGELKRAQYEYVTSDPSQAALSEGRVWWNHTELRAKFDTGAVIRAFLANDQKCVIGNNGTANTNVRINRSGVALLEFLLGGDTTAEGSASGVANWAKLNAKLGGSLLDTYADFTEVADPASPAAGNQRLFWSTDHNLYSINSSGTKTKVNTSPIAPSIQKFTSGSGTYTTPAGVLYIRVRCVGGGGGGGGSGTASGANGGNGGDTTFGSSLVTGGGGIGGAKIAGTAGTGGTATATGLTGVTAVGGDGAPGQNGGNTLANFFCEGGNGGDSMFGGGGYGGANGIAGHLGGTNTGGGGGGGGGASAVDAGSGGGAGGGVDVIITSPAATYAYSVGAAGTAGTAGTSGFIGGAGAAGVIIVEEYRQ